MFEIAGTFFEIAGACASEAEKAKDPDVKAILKGVEKELMDMVPSWGDLTNKVINAEKREYAKN